MLHLWEGRRLTTRLPDWTIGPFRCTASRSKLARISIRETVLDYHFDDLVMDESPGKVVALSRSWPLTFDPSHAIPRVSDSMHDLDAKLLCGSEFVGEDACLDPSSAGVIIALQMFGSRVAYDLEPDIRVDRTLRNDIPIKAIRDYAVDVGICDKMISKGCCNIGHIKALALQLLPPCASSLCRSRMRVPLSHRRRC